MLNGCFEAVLALHAGKAEVKSMGKSHAWQGGSPRKCMLALKKRPHGPAALTRPLAESAKRALPSASHCHACSHHELSCQATMMMHNTHAPHPAAPYCCSSSSSSPAAASCCSMTLQQGGAARPRGARFFFCASVRERERVFCIPPAPAPQPTKRARRFLQ